MLKHIDIPRFNLAITTGRRFYCICMLLLKYVEILGVNGPSSLNCCYSRNYTFDLRLSSNRINSFNSLDDYSNSSDDYDSSCMELFNILDSSMYINIWKVLNPNQFKRRYMEEYSKDILQMMYAASKTIIPIEINLCATKIKCIYGDKKILDGKRYPLVDTLYRSDEIMKFINIFTSIITMSSFLYHDIISEHCSIEEYDTDRYERIYKTWDSKLIDLKRLFSKIKERSR